MGRGTYACPGYVFPTPWADSLVIKKAGVFTPAFYAHRFCLVIVS